ncbi:MAG TPA: hypothetical protein VMB50_19560 [Myxococcales bacterium]|nr:hypothetical protein [Myxococcales bacterium]
MAARRVLLDALEALGNHRKAVMLVGAQAVYLHVGNGDLAVAPYTTDGDLAIDPRELDDEPALPATLRAAGFELTVRPGTWTRTEVQIDFLVPASLGGGGRRGARLGTHGNHFARKATGLEAAIADNARMNLSALDPTDGRAFDVSVAGVAALLVAKLHKIAERRGHQDRLQDKDGLDVLRLLRFADTTYLAGTLERLAAHPIAGEATRQVHPLLQDLFGDRTSLGTQMAVRASAGLEDGDAIALSCETLARRLLAAWTP